MSTTSSGIVEIPLRARDGSVRAVALIDEIDAELVNARRWKLTKKGYAQCEKVIGGKWASIRLHRLVMGVEPGDPRQVDHVNRDKLDCRRENLRIASAAQQAENVPARGGSSPHRGVFKHGASWQVRVGRQHIGTFADEAVAAAAAVAARRELMPFAID